MTFQTIREIEHGLFRYGRPLYAVQIRAVLRQRTGAAYQIWKQLAGKLNAQPELVSAMLRHNDWRFNFRGVMVACLQHQTQHYEEDFIWRLANGMHFGAQTVAAGWAVLSRPDYIPALESV